MPPAYKLIFMTKQSDSGSRNTATLATTPAPPARLASKHLLGIEGLNPLEINALIDRGDMFADLIQEEQPITPPLSEVLKGRTVLNLFFENSTRTRVLIIADPKMVTPHFDVQRLRDDDPSAQRREESRVRNESKDLLEKQC